MKEAQVQYTVSCSGAVGRGRSAPYGIYDQGGTRRTLTLEGKIVLTSFPAGVVSQGKVKISV